MTSITNNNINDIAAHLGTSQLSTASLSFQKVNGSEIGVVRYLSNTRKKEKMERFLNIILGIGIFFLAISMLGCSSPLNNILKRRWSSKKIERLLIPVQDKKSLMKSFKQAVENAKTN